MEHTHRVSTDEIIAMYNNGMSQSDIAKATGLSQAAVGYRMRRAGFMVGKGRHNPFKGGAKVSEDEVKAREKQEIAEKSAANACLMVMDNVITLEGVIGRYEVSRKDKKVLATINGDEFDFTFEQVIGLCDEFRALARNLDSVEAVGAEMW